LKKIQKNLAKFLNEIYNNYEISKYIYFYYAMSKKTVIYLFFAVGVFFSSMPAFSQQASIGANALYEQGLEYYDKGLTRLAAEYFRRCLEQEPSHQQAKKYLGIIGQSYITAEVEFARERYEAARDVAGASRTSEAASSYSLPVARNLDYRTAGTSSVVNPQALPVNQQIQQQAAQQAQEDFASRYNIREDAIAQARQDYILEKQRQAQEKKRKPPRSRREVIDKALEDASFKMDFEYQFVFGEQSFRIINADGSDASKLTFPVEGGMGIVNAEARIFPRLFIGGRFGISNLNNTTSKDEDWSIVFVGDYYYTQQKTKNEAQLWDANIYYRMFDWDKQELGDYMKGMLLVDRLYIDIFGGYQYYKGRTTMIDPITEEHWELLGVPLLHNTSEQAWGLNSQYEVIHKGPRAGLRLGGSLTEKLSSNVSLAYAWLDTKSYGNWNLRNFNWKHEGNDGYGFNVDVEALYHITPDWYVGAGFHYLHYVQDKLLYTGVQPGSSFTDLDQARDEEVTAYGPSLKFGCRF